MTLKEMPPQNPLPSGAAALPVPRPLRVTFVAPFSLFDIGNGAAQSIRTMLEQLAARGVQASVIMGCCFDTEPVSGSVALLESHGLKVTGSIEPRGVPLWHGVFKGVEYHVIQENTWKRDLLSAIEELHLRDAIRFLLERQPPDVVLTFGGLLLDIEIQRCARAVGAKVVFYLANPSYSRPETFAGVDLILTNSSATADHYARTMQLRCRTVGLFVDTAPTVAAQREPGFVTLINPSPEKGVALFLRLVERAAREAPDMRFLVVESRGKLLESMSKLGFPAGLMAQITVLPKQERMARVYAQTRVLLMPSFWFEAAGRVLLEANANGIPVLATDRGGIPETLGGAGRLLPIPDRCTKELWSIPTEEEVSPWWDELLRLWRDPAYHAALSQRALEVAVGQNIVVQAAYLESLLRAVLDQH